MRKPEPERKDIPGPVVTRVGGGGTPQPQPEPQPEPAKEEGDE